MSAPLLRLVPPLPDAKEEAWRAFADEVTRLHNADPDVLAFEAALAQWHRVQSAYWALRAAWVTPRKPGTKASRAHDTGLATFLDERGHFKNRFWGFVGKGGKREGAHDPKVRRVMAAYQAQWNYWVKKTPGYAKAKAKENRRRNQLPEVKAQKAAWNESPEGKAWRAKYLADAKAKRAVVRAAKKAARESLKDV